MYQEILVQEKYLHCMGHKFFDKDWSPLLTTVETLYQVYNIVIKKYKFFIYSSLAPLKFAEYMYIGAYLCSFCSANLVNG